MSVTTFDLAVRRKDKKELDSLLSYLIENNVNFRYEFVLGNMDSDNVYQVIIENYCWASNLKQIAKLLKKGEPK
jgi:hypothetical protein